MALTFTVDPLVGPALRDGLLALWTEVSNAGGAVGFVPPVTTDDIRPALVKHLAAMAEGTHHLVVGHDEDGEVAAAAVLALNPHRLMRHWVWAYTVMVAPASRAGERAARSWMPSQTRPARWTASRPSA